MVFDVLASFYFESPAYYFAAYQKNKLLHSYFFICLSSVIFLYHIFNFVAVIVNPGHSYLILRSA